MRLLGIPTTGVPCHSHVETCEMWRMNGRAMTWFCIRSTVLGLLVLWLKVRGLALLQEPGHMGKNFPLLCYFLLRRMPTPVFNAMSAGNAFFPPPKLTANP